MKRLLPLLAVSLTLAGAGCSSQTAYNAPSAAAPNTSQTYSIADVQSANTQEKCWTTIGGKVYDLTGYLSQHPGGIDNIMKLCGTDGSAAFAAQHGGQGRPEQELARLQIGVIK